MQKLKLKNEKGFLGPIGDDLPSLIPLIFALMIFFASFSFTFNIFDKRNEYFENSLTVLKISSTLGNAAGSYISSIDEFDQLCQTLNVKRVRYWAFLAKLDADIDIEEIDDMLFEHSLTNDFYICKNTDDRPTYLTRNISVRLVPVAVEISDDDTFYVQPVLLVVIAWPF